MSFDLEALREAVAREGRVARVLVAEAKGSAPREAGAAMLVWDGGQSGTIGGGALEFEAAARARAMLAAGGTPLTEVIPPPSPIPSPRGGGEAPGGAMEARGGSVARMALGPALQQCCGGAVTLVTEVWDADRLAALEAGEGVRAGLVARAVVPGAAMPLWVRRRLQAARGQGRAGGVALAEGWVVEPVAAPERLLWVWGAGHVGRAIVSVLAPLPGLAITWIDTDRARFPDTIPDGVEPVVAADPAALAPFAPEAAEHLVLTYSHALDLALCHALLTRGFARLGLIGSATKWARFRKRLAGLGHAPGAIARIDCPIGDPRLGKHPQAIAVSVAAAFLARRGEGRTAREGTR